MLHLGSLAKCMPLHMHAFGYWAYPLIRGLTLFMVVFSGWYAVLFWYRMTGQLEYATYEVHWLMLPDSLNPKQKDVLIFLKYDFQQACEKLISILCWDKLKHPYSLYQSF